MLTDTFAYVITGAVIVHILLFSNVIPDFFSLSPSHSPSPNREKFFQWIRITYQPLFAYFFYFLAKNSHINLALFLSIKTCDWLSLKIKIGVLFRGEIN